MVERKHSGSYEVSDRPHTAVETGWCTTRNIPVFMTALCCAIIYIIGSIITGVTYRGRTNFPLNCTTTGRYQPTHLFVYDTPLVVVGPCFMSAGGAILLYLLLQWILCRPNIK